MVAGGAKDLAASPRRERWFFSAEEDAALLEAYRSGVTMREVAIRLGRPPGSIHDRMVLVLRSAGIDYQLTRVYKRWTLAEECRARALFKKTGDYAAVAEATGRTIKAVKSKLLGWSLNSSGWKPAPKTGAPPSPEKLAAMLADRPADRVCLKCRRTFPSAHAGNRLCGKCKRSNESTTSGLPAHLVEAHLY